jgi:hypothetical protein
MYRNFEKAIVFVMGIILIYSLTVLDVFANDIEGSEAIEQVEVIHLGQEHKLDHILEGQSYDEMLLSSPERLERILRSQHAIARYIINNSAVPVFVEKEIEDRSYENYCNSPKAIYKGESICTIMKKAFPEGIPHDFCALKDYQKSTLYYFGGSGSVFLLGIIPKIYGTLSKELLKKYNFTSFDDLYKKFKHELRQYNLSEIAIEGYVQKAKDLMSIDEARALKQELMINNISSSALDLGITLAVGEDREAVAINKIKSAIENNSELSSQTRFFLVYGDNHDFQKECQNHGYKITKLSFVFSVLKEEPGCSQSNLSIDKKEL